MSVLMLMWFTHITRFPPVIECTSLPLIENGSITYAPDSEADHTLDTVATYSCSTGYFLDLSATDSSATRTCVDNGDNDAEGVFDMEAPTCVRK